ncbi:MAG: transglutaminaseTgpA domain-containing protein, partial [Myxococcota bacterium]
LWPWLHGVVLALTGVIGLFGSSLPAFALLTGWLLVFQVWSGRTADNARTAILLATLMLLLGCVQSDTALLAPAFVAYAALLPVALLRAQLLDVEAAPPRALEVSAATGSAFFASLLFAFLPRLDGGYVGGGGGRASFPEDVQLGDDGVVSDELAMVLRMRVTNAEGRGVGGPFHVRGRVLDHFDGRRWRATLPADRWEDIPWNRRAEVWLEPLASDVLFSVGEPDHVEGIANVRRDGNRGFYHRQPGRALHYVVYGRVADARGEMGEENPAWLQLPKVDPGVRSLAWSIVPEEDDPYAIAAAMRARLATEWPYDPTPEAPGKDPVAEFLLQKKAGHCEYFATALAVMLRERQVPARLATGFHTGEVDDEGLVIARRGHGHAWVEVLTSRGWAVVDPTPDAELPDPETGSLAAKLEAFAGAWYRNVVDYDAQAQFAAWGALGRPFVSVSGPEAQAPFRAGILGMFIGLGGLVALVLGVRAVLARVGGGAPRGGPGDTLARQVQAARAAVRARGWSLPDDLPPVEAAGWLSDRAGEAAAAPFAKLAWLTYRARYGGEAHADAVAEAKACVRELRRMPKAQRR